MPIVNTEAFVIGYINYKESDRIIDFYTYSEGKVSAVAKNVRKIGKRYGCSFELLSLLNIAFFKKEGKELYSLSSAELVKSIPNIDSGLEIIASISFIVELIREFCPAGQKNKDIYGLLSWIHNLFETGKIKLLNMDVFMLKLLDFSGFFPYIEGCVSCNEDISNEKYYFSALKNGLICSNCVNYDTRENPINLGMIKFMEKIRSSRLDFLERLKLSLKSSLYLFDILESYIQSILQKKLKTSQFLKEINSNIQR
ncbi:DNA repair protein RecO [bacterium]|nr:DNA repair protein RecO [bacterium]